METWRSAQRVQERRLWSTLSFVGAVLALTLASSILLVSGDAASPAPAWFYVQQAILLVLSLAGTASSVRRWRAARARG